MRGWEQASQMNTRLDNAVSRLTVTSSAQMLEKTLE